MAKIYHSDSFSGALDPIAQPSSNDSFAASARLARMARFALKSRPRRVRILFNPGGAMNAADENAFLAGLLNFASDDERISSARELARQAEMAFEFAELPKPNRWPGSVTFELEGEAGDSARFVGQPLGGGAATSLEIDGFPVRWEAESCALLVSGDPAALGAAFDALRGENPAEVQSLVDSNGEHAFFFKFSTPPNLAKIEIAKEILHGAAEYRYFPAPPAAGQSFAATKDRRLARFREHLKKVLTTDPKSAKYCNM